MIQKVETERPYELHVSSAVEVGIMAGETLQLWSDLATHYAALRWHRVTVPRPKGCGNILPSMLSCQNQQVIKSA